MHTPPRRRTVLAAALAVTSAAAGCSVPEPRRTAPTADPAPGKPIASAPARRALLLQVAAHPDDDLYFMNPDSQRLLDAGVPLVSVYVTAGEHTGRNRIAGMPDTPPDRAAYSSARHQGLRQSYAVALGLPAFTPWRRETLALPDGRRAELDTLTHGARRVELVFLNLPMHTSRRYMALPALWHDRALELRTHLSTGSPVTRSDTYDYDRLVGVLAELFHRYRPTVVHTLDPDPDVQTSDEATRKRDSEQPGYSDHGDHTAVACFTWAALARWVTDTVGAGGPIPAFTTTAFRGYYNRHWPKNLPPGPLKEKAARLVPYGGDPSWECGNPSGCGDYGVGGDRPLTNRKGWVRSTHHRWPSAGPALAREPDGRLGAYGVLGLRAVRWRERTPGAWSAPEDLGGGPLAPALGSAVLADGRVLLFGVRFAALDGHGGPNRRELVLLEQRSPGGPFLAWTGLGNPERGDDRGRRIGAPVAVTAPDGRVHLFVRNAEKGVSTRVRAAADGSWGPWRALPGTAEVQDGLAVSLDGSGRVHLYAAGRESVRHWVDGVERTEPLPRSGSTVASAGGELYHRAPAAAALLGPGGDAGLDGFGGVVAARSASLGTVLLGTDEEGRVRVRSGGRLRTRTTGPSAVSAALHLGAPGVTVVGLGADGRPWSWRP
ncbi:MULTISPECIES: PIG-L family deacetylase [unclassified Streptomyces]|uniref:PIG-L family deacetylase n=1 Tax=unclassified Streptomyces TaxID=2593676 RepID=UPI0006FC0897|nr:MULTISPECIES: PIG-L family deacetylase [unclassified Streptomyces]KQX59182.1 LmbE family protein [Streptomyces sp. Root1304]KRB00443.1 LmbE family protein [Streptomyces sp. Root66D1]